MKKKRKRWLKAVFHKWGYSWLLAPKAAQWCSSNGSGTGSLPSLSDVRVGRILIFLVIYLTCSLFPVDCFQEILWLKKSKPFSAFQQSAETQENFMVFETFHVWHLWIRVFANHCRNCFTELGFVFFSELLGLCWFSFGSALIVCLSWRKGVRYPLTDVLQLPIWFSVVWGTGEGEVEGNTALPPSA